jgi:hypothetical protein
VDFADKDPLYTKNVPADLRARMDVVIRKLRSGALSLPVPRM